MPYRIFKHMIGETPLARRSRLILGAAVLILISAGFFWYARKIEQTISEELLLNTSRLLVKPILMLRHWQALETDRSFREVIDETFGGMLQDEVKGYKFRFIWPTNADHPDHRPENNFEYESLNAFEKGEAEWKYQVVATDPAEPRYQYVEAIRLKDQCRPCHQTLIGPDPSSRVYLEPGQLMGAVSVSIPLAWMEKANKENR